MTATQVHQKEHGTNTTGTVDRFYVELTVSKSGQEQHRFTIGQAIQRSFKN